jgi:hypothetical protein
VGQHASLVDYGKEPTEETTSFPPPLRHCIDWHAVARDAKVSGHLVAINTAWDVVHVFAGADMETKSYRIILQAIVRGLPRIMRHKWWIYASGYATL